MTEVGMHEAKSKLPQLVERAAGGEDIVITRDGRPIVRLEPVNALGKVHGALRGRISLADDFDELPDDIADQLGAR